MTTLSTNHWQYALSRPSATATFKQYAEDFQVNEDLGYTPSGEGEHQFLWVEKINNNTAFVAEQLAKYCKLPLRNVTYAGRKDKYSVSRQWFGLHAPGQPDFDFSAWALPGVTISSRTRHHKKLRTGQLKGNRFSILLRNVSDGADVTARLERVRQQGVPNYFGEQRFGVVAAQPEGEQRGGNLMMAQRMLQGEAIRNRNKRSMALSALRSWLFNEVISERMRHGQFDNILCGDALVLGGSNSFFIAEEPDDTLMKRYQSRDLAPSAPLWGKGDLHTSDAAREIELTVAENHSNLCQFLQDAGMSQERRPVKIWPQELEWQQDGDRLAVSFTLPAGCFATSVLRECVLTTSPS